MALTVSYFIQVGAGVLALAVVARVVSAAPPRSLGPLFADIAAAGYRDAVDPDPQRRAAIWYAAGWGARRVDAAAGVALLVALTRPASGRAAV
jgi:hypothetical protein